MSLRDDLKMIAEYYRDVRADLCANEKLLEIQEGKLLCHVEEELKKQLSGPAFETCRHRIPPINVQKRVIDKTSQIYAKPPERKLGASATEADVEVWDWYLDKMKVDISGQTLNEYFNLNKCSAWEPYLDNKFIPRLRELPKDRFFVIGANRTNPLTVTHFVKVMGKEYSRDENGKPVEKVVLFAYTDTEFSILYDDGLEATTLMKDYNQDGKNIYGVIPFVYVNRSKTCINPPSDDDMFRMVTLVPILFTDINYAVMFQAFSIYWGVDVDLEKLPINPNSFINLKSDPLRPEAKPSLNTIKGDVDSEKAVNSIMDQLALWLQSRNIRPGSVGDANKDNFTNGISKMIDEMDTTGDRKKQIPYFVNAEEELFYLIAYKMHPVWSKNPSFTEKRQFSQGLDYNVKFSEQISWQTRLELTQEAQAEVNLGVLSRESAMQRINPEMSQEELNAEFAKVKAEMAVFSPGPIPGDKLNPVQGKPQPRQGNQQMQPGQMPVEQVPPGPMPQ